MTKRSRIYLNCNQVRLLRYARNDAVANKSDLTYAMRRLYSVVFTNFITCVHQMLFNYMGPGLFKFDRSKINHSGPFLGKELPDLVPDERETGIVRLLCCDGVTLDIQ